MSILKEHFSRKHFSVCPMKSILKLMNLINWWNIRKKLLPVCSKTPSRKSKKSVILLKTPCLSTLVGTAWLTGENVKFPKLFRGKKILPHTKEYQEYHRGNMKTHQVKSKNSLGTINDAVSFLGWNKLCNIVGEVKNPNVFLRGVILLNRFSLENLPGWIQPAYWDRVS